MLDQNPKGSEAILLSYAPSATVNNRTICEGRRVLTTYKTNTIGYVGFQRAAQSRSAQ